MVKCRIISIFIKNDSNTSIPSHYIVHLTHVINYSPSTYPKSPCWHTSLAHSNTPLLVLYACDQRLSIYTQPVSRLSPAPARHLLHDTALAAPAWLAWIL